jgi:uncharacterized damage-inducible protein DinB
MTEIDLQEHLENVRLQLLEAIAELPDEALLAPGAVGEWSIRDLLFLLTAWDAELVTGLMQIKQRKQPKRLLDALANRAGYEKAQQQIGVKRDLDPVFDDLQQVRLELEDWITQFSDRELSDPGAYPWLPERPLWSLIAETSYQNEERYLPAVESFARAWLGVPYVPLGEIEVSDQ